MTVWDITLGVLLALAFRDIILLIANEASNWYFSRKQQKEFELMFDELINTLENEKSKPVKRTTKKAVAKKRK